MPTSLFCILIATSEYFGTNRPYTFREDNSLGAYNLLVNQKLLGFPSYIQCTLAIAKMPTLSLAVSHAFNSPTISIRVSFSLLLEVAEVIDSGFFDCSAAVVVLFSLPEF